VFELRVNLQSPKQIVKQDRARTSAWLIDVIKRIINCVEDNSRMYSRLRSLSTLLPQAYVRERDTRLFINVAPIRAKMQSAVQTRSQDSSMLSRCLLIDAEDYMRRTISRRCLFSVL